MNKQYVYAMFMVLIATAACTVKKQYHQTIRPSSPNSDDIGSPIGGGSPAQGLDGNDSDNDGNASGGGNRGDRVSLKILNTSIKELTTELRSANPAVFSTLPEGWRNPERMAKIIENIVIEKNKVFNDTDGVEKVFHYRTSPTGELQIVAYKLFFDTRSVIPVDVGGIDNYVGQTKIDLLKEVAHHLKIGITLATDEDSVEFAKAVRAAFKKDNLLCQLNDPPKNWAFDSRKKEEDKFTLLMLNRPTGAGNLTGLDLGANEFDPNYSYYELYSLAKNGQKFDIDNFIFGTLRDNYGKEKESLDEYWLYSSKIDSSHLEYLRTGKDMYDENGWKISEKVAIDINDTKEWPITITFKDQKGSSPVQVEEGVVNGSCVNTFEPVKWNKDWVK